MAAGSQEQPLVSVGCAVYNGSETLRRALEGIAAQDYPRVEIIICDDGSTDESPDICREFAAKHANVRFIQNPKNLGILGNYNKLFGLANGKYFMWADQDDVRDPTYISKAVAVLESDETAVLCHSHTGVFWKSFDNLMHVNTLDRIDHEQSVVRRYWRFLRTYSDTTIYGLIRADALRKTALWRPANGASVALLFELLLQGSFRQVPETLYFYAAKGKRPSPEEEYRRCNGGRPMPTHMRPFLVVAVNQVRGVMESTCNPIEKAVLLTLLGNHLAIVNGAKATFRAVEAIRGRHAPAWLERWCEYAVWDHRDVHCVVPPAEDPLYYAAGSSLRRQ